MRRTISKSLTLSLAILFVGAMTWAGCVNRSSESRSASPPPATVALTARPTAPPATATQAPVAPPPPAAKSLWQEIADRGVMAIGVSAQYPPFAYYNANGQLDGFDIALMKAIGERLGVDVAFQDMPFEATLESVQAGDVDAAVGGIAITPARAQRMLFTQPYLTAGVALLANADGRIDAIDSLDDLTPWTIAAERGTIFSEWLLSQADAGALSQEQIRLYADIDQALTALLSGEADLLIADAFTAEDLTRQTRGQLQLLNKRGKVTLTYRPLVDKPLQGVSWILTSYANEAGELTPVLTGVRVTAIIDDAVIKGSAGCNTYAADYLIKEKGIRITPPVITRKTCAQPEGVMEQENRFLVDLRKSEAYQIIDDFLVFRDAKGHVTLIFRAQPEVDLANITWTLYAYGPVAEPAAAPAEMNITLTVDKEGRVAGFAGCNAYTGKATMNGDAVGFELGIATTKVCDSFSNSVEAAYLTALADVTRGEIQQDRLILYYNGGLDALKFHAARRNPLQFSQWRLLSFGKPERERFPLSTTQLTARFGAERLAGSAGCNTFSTPYSVQDDRLKIGKIALTRKLCPDAKVTRQENDYVKALRNSVRYRLTGVEIVTSELYTQTYGIAAPPGADDLLARLNDALTQLTQEGVIDQLQQQYLPLAPAAAAAAPAPDCIDKMTWIADLTYDDKAMKRPPKIEPGTPFTKTWRVKNTGSCTWTKDYYLDFARGNKPGADMSGQRTHLAQDVHPGETYDLALDLVAPTRPGVYQGFWRLFNAQGRDFAELWVGIQVPKSATPAPSPTATPAPLIQLTADSTHIPQGACTTLYWHAQGVSQAYLFEEGEAWEGKDVAPQGSKEVCPTQTATYILGVISPDGSRQTASLTVIVSTVTPPDIVSFTATPPDQATLGQPIQLHWDVRGDVQRVRLLVNDAPLDANAPVYGSLTHQPQALGTMKYTLEAEGPGGVRVTDLVVEVVNQIPAPTDTPLPEPTPAPEPTQEPSPGGDLMGRTWTLLSRSQAKMAPIPALPGTEITMLFAADGAYSGSAGCNVYQGAYTLTAEGGLLLDPPIATRQRCDTPEGVMEQEAAYLGLLPAVIRYEVNDAGQLILYTSDKWQLIFQQLTAAPSP